MDPIGVADGNPHSDKYAPEAQRILARADEAKSLDDLIVIISDVFEQQFGADSLRSDTDVRDLAAALWAPLQELIARR